MGLIGRICRRAKGSRILMLPSCRICCAGSEGFSLRRNVISWLGCSQGFKRLRRAKSLPVLANVLTISMQCWQSDRHPTLSQTLSGKRLNSSNSSLLSNLRRPPLPAQRPTNSLSKSFIIAPTKPACRLRIGTIEDSPRGRESLLANIVKDQIVFCTSQSQWSYLYNPKPYRHSTKHDCS